MIDRIIRFSIHNKLIVGFFILLLLGWGIYSASELSIGAVPDITNNQVQIITTSPSLAAQEVEQFITFPLEMELGNTPGMIEIRSVSRFGLSVITVVFEEDHDIYLARQLISERIKIAEEQIPEGLGKPQLGPISTGLGEIYQYVIYPEPGFEDQYTPMELRSIQDWIIKRQLVGIPGVIEVNSIGGYVKQFEIAIEPGRLKAAQLNLVDIYEAIYQNNANTGGSYIEKDPYTYFIRGEGLVKSSKDLEQILVKQTDAYPVYLRDVAKVRLGYSPRFGAVSMNGMGEVVAGQVMMLKGENAAAVTKRVKERMELIKPSLPEGIVLEAYLDRTKLVNQTIDTVVTNLVEGGLIVIFVLVLLLGNIRASLIVASVIPLSMLFAISMMHMFGISANLMSLGAIDFGLIVDGAVIIVEAILFHLHQLTQKPADQDALNREVFNAASYTRKSAAFGEIIILIVYLPIFYLSGIEGKMFQPMAQTVSFAITGALILSLTYVPMMSSLFLSPENQHKATFSSTFMGWLRKGYAQILVQAMKAKIAWLLITILLFGGSLWMLSRMGGAFIPTLEEGDFALHQILPPGSSISEGIKVSKNIQDILLDQFPEVEKVVTKIGTAEIPTDIMPMEAGDIYVILKPKKEWTSAYSREEMFEKMEAALSEFPGVMYEFTQPIQMRFNELMTGVRQDIAIKIFGESPGVLAQKAKEAKTIIQNIEGVGDIQVEVTGGLQQIMINYDRSRLAQYGLDIATINRMIKGSFAGEKAGVLYEGERRYDIVVRLDEAFRADPSQIEHIYIPLNNGQQVPLGTLAKVILEEGPTQISRENTQRRITIGVNARGRDLQSLVSEIEETLARDLELPSGYFITFGGQFENFRQARERLVIAVPIALFLIFILLYFTFQSFTQALLIFTAIPMSAIGGIWALYLREMPFSISAGVGFIALFGVAVLNGIVMIAYFNRLKKEGVAHLMERILQGTQARLRPVIMTAMVASLGFLPMAISTAPGAEVQQPLATVVIGGLISATFLTLVILPILYYFSETYVPFRPSDNSKQTMLNLLCIVILCSPVFSIAQSIPNAPIPISLQEALQRAKSYHPESERSHLYLQQQRIRAEGGILYPKMNIFFSGEENDFERFDGVNSFGFIQNFILPSTSKTTKTYLIEQQSLAGIQVELTQKEIERQVRKAYYHLSYNQTQQTILTNTITRYQEFLRIMSVRFEEGEDAKIPLLTIQNQLNELIFQLTAANRDIEIAQLSFNYWLISDTVFIASPDSANSFPNFSGVEDVLHPLIRYDAQQVNVSYAQLEVTKSKLHPQIQVGAQLQTIAGAFPFFGYQLGIVMPIFRKAYMAEKRAAEVQVKIQEEALYSQQLMFIQQKTAILQRITASRDMLKVLIQDLLPDARDQLALSEEAFLNQEVPYDVYMDSLNQSLKLELNILDLKRKLADLHAEWIYYNN